MEMRGVERNAFDVMNLESHLNRTVKEQLSKTPKDQNIMKMVNELNSASFGYIN